jgi:hypothetical protein
MSRRRLGTHGKPLMWTDNKVRMTIRHEPSILLDEDLAMLLGRYLDIQNNPYYYDDDMTEEKAVFIIWKYETENKLTQKHALEMINDSYYIAQYHQGTDLFECFDNDEVHHRVLLNLVHRIWPQFKTNACEAQ